MGATFSIRSFFSVYLAATRAALAARALIIALGLAVVTSCAASAGPTRATASIRNSTGGFVEVTPTGNDATCSRSNVGHPCASWRKAYRVATAGDVVLLAAGSYPSQTIVNDPTKGADPVTFQPQPGAQVVVNGLIQLGDNTGADSGAAPSNIVLQGFEIVGAIRQWWTTGSTIQPTNIVLRDLRLHWNPFDGLPSLTLSSPSHVLVSHVQIGPTCCNSDGIVLGKGPDTPNPSDITFDHVVVHDVANNCSSYPDSNCADFGQPTPDLVHVDCLQAYGGDRIAILSSRFSNCATQGIFAGAASGGSFSDWTIENTMVGAIPGGQSNHTIIFGNAPGTPGLYHGSFRFVHDTMGTGGAYLFYPSEDIDPSTQFEFTANIGTFDPPCPQETGTWTFQGNVFLNKKCSPSDVRADPHFVNDAVINPDLRLAAGSPGLGAARGADLPSLDIDGNMRPLTLPSDSGASQRETAAFVPRRSIGAVTLGASRATIEEFYGPAHSPRATKIDEKPVRVASYRRHGGTLWVGYDASDTVVAAGTTSPYYTTPGGIGPGSDLHVRASYRWLECRQAYSLRAGNSTAYFSTRGPSSTRIRSISIVRGGQRHC